MFTVFLCTYRVLCSSVHQYIQFVFFVAFAFGGEGKGRREEGGGSDNWKELHQKVKKEPLSMYAIFSLLAKSLFWHAFFTHFFPFFPIFKEKMKKKVLNILKFDSFECVRTIK